MDLVTRNNMNNIVQTIDISFDTFTHEFKHHLDILIESLTFLLKNPQIKSEALENCLVKLQSYFSTYELDQNLYQIKTEEVLAEIWNILSKVKISHFDIIDSFIMVYISSSINEFDPLVIMRYINKASSVSDYDGIFKRFIFALKFRFISMEKYETIYERTRIVGDYNFIIKENLILKKMQTNFSTFKTQIYEKFCNLLNRLTIHVGVYFDRMTQLTTFSNLPEQVQSEIKSFISKLSNKFLLNKIIQASDFTDNSLNILTSNLYFSLLPFPDVGSYYLEKCFLSAAETGNIKLLSLLIQSGLDINVTDLYGYNALMLSCFNGSHECTQLLLDCGAAANNCRSDGVYPLHISASSNHFDCTRVLVEHGANINIPNRNNGWRPIMNSIQMNSISILNLFLDNGVDINSTDNKGNSPLIVSSKFNIKSCLNYLIKFGALIDHEDHEGTSAIMHAGKNGYAECIMALFQSGAKDKDKLGNNPIIYTTQNGQISCLHRLTNIRKYINQAGYEGLTPLIIAAKKGYNECLSFLLDNRANVNSQDDTGATAFIYAAKNGDLNHLTMLYSKGANIELTTLDGSTALIHVVKNNHISCLSYLIKIKAKINTKNNNGMTALMEARFLNNTECIKLLVECGADQ